MDNEQKIRWIATQLTARFGPLRAEAQDPVEMLVLTILSQNTTDVNRDRAFASLMSQFKTLDRVREAPLEKIASAIRVGGLHQQKAQSIHAALQRICEERGRLELSFLEDLSLSAARDWLLDVPGIGPKTAGIVLLFSFGLPIFPVDTHIRRVMSRIGLISGRGDPHPRLNELLPDDPSLMQHLHLSTIRLGRELCHPRHPECADCPIRSVCEWAEEHGAHSADRVPSAQDTGGAH
jgi:endonuclease-3